jgi:hypothetical protein
MAIQTINIGNVVNDGLGDDLRTAFQKVNANFSDLNSTLTITGSNVGITGSNVFKQKVNNNLEFRSLVSGTKMSLVETDTSILLNSTAPDAFVRIDTNAGSVEASTYEQITIQGGKDVDVTAFGSVVTVNTILPVTQILTYVDFGPITGQFENSIQLALASANIDFGTIVEPSRFALDCGTII